MIYFYFLVLAFLLAYAMSYFFKNFFTLPILLDIPNERSSHELPILRGGGLSFVIAFFICLICFTLFEVIDVRLLIAISGAGGLVAFIGFIDDLGHIPSIFRLILHAIAATWAVYWLNGLEGFSLSEDFYSNNLMIILVVIFFLVWFLNLFNFMDGIDGLACSEAVFIAFGGGVFSYFSKEYDLAFLFALLGASVLGFLKWNWPPAKIFMGDVGSGFLGIIIGVLVYASYLEGISLWSYLLLLGVFVSDASITLIRRFFQGDKWYAAHKSHAYQWSARKWGHKKVSAGAILINIVWLLPLAYVALIYPSYGAILFALGYAPLIIAVIFLGAGKRLYDK